jgi:hypothetical protein
MVKYPKKDWLLMYDIKYLLIIHLFKRHSCLLNNLKQRIIENRFLVFLARFMYKYNKNIVFSTDPCFKLLKKKQSTDKQTINQSIDASTTTTSTTPTIESIIIVLNEKCHNMCKELIRNYLTLLDNWPACSEFYNQIIEGNLIEHLLWLQFDDKTEMKSITSRSNNNIATKSSSSISKSSIKFNYCEYSFNLLYKLCRDYHGCRAEFGRNGGLTKFLTRIDQFQTLNKLTNNEMKQIEVICFSCKESVNRFRLKEQNHLIALIKLQQRLKKALVAASNNNKKNDFCLDSLDATLFNKLLVAICGFVHDQDSMNVLLNNGIIDSFISFLNDSYEQIINQSKTMDLNQFKEYLNKLKQKSVLLKHLLSINNNDINNTNKKRKVSDQLDISNAANKPKKSKQQQNSKLTPSSPLNLMDYSEHIQLQQQQQLGSSPTESYCSLSPACNPFSPTFSLSSPPTTYNTNSSSTTTLNRMHHLSSAMSPNSSSNDAVAYNTSPKFNWSSSNEDLYQINNYNNNCTIQFSPSIKNEDSEEEDEEEEKEKEQQIYDEVEAEEEDTNKSTNNKPPILTNQQSIETINRTEGCVFYVLSQLSHGDKPSIHLFNNFESITICLLKYLKNAKVRNPRALRILNRLTKNHYCFTFFVSIQLPYRIKEILFNNTTTPTTGIMNQKKDQDIEKEMNIYLNSNKVFFDAHSSFPSFESIEFTLINNLKSQCISSSDHGYLTLIQMIKLNQKKQDRVCTSLVAPFILRNSKALHYIMIQLNGIDLVIDLLFSDCCLENERLKSILCLKKILNFVSYKQDAKKLKENFDLVKIKFNDYYNNKSVKDDDNDKQIEFILDQQSIKVNRQLVAKKSEYFNTLLNGQFIESNCELSRIEMKDVSYEPFKLIISLLMQLDLDEIKNELNFELCIETVLICDRFMLNELKDLFIQLLINQFLNLNTFVLISKLGWYLNNSSLEQAAVDYFLSKFILFNDFDDLDMNLINSDDYYLNKLSNFVEFTLECLLNKQNCLIMTRIESNQQQQQQETKLFLDSFKKSLKNALGEIVKK